MKQPPKPRVRSAKQQALLPTSDAVTTTLVAGALFWPKKPPGYGE